MQLGVQYDSLTAPCGGLNVLLDNIAAYPSRYSRQRSAPLHGVARA